ncbi:MAG: hypothetical protein RLZZ04_638 [Cyanobacteriota bacterium]|jgi:hypothetical protein
MSSWICDGVPKDGKDYPDFSGPHEPISNDLPDCEYCGLPQEAMIVGSGSESVTQILGGSGNRSRVILIGAIGALILVVGSIAYFTGFTSWINGDRHLKTYEAAIASGDQALSIIGSHNNPEELTQAQEYLSSAIVELSKIPQKAAIYADAEAKMNNYDNLSVQIANKLNSIGSNSVDDWLCAEEPKPKKCIY